MSITIGSNTESFVTATMMIDLTATIGERQISVTTPVGTSNAVSFAVNPGNNGCGDITIELISASGDVGAILPSAGTDYLVGGGNGGNKANFAGTAIFEIDLTQVSGPVEIKTGWELEAQSLGRFAGSGVVQFDFSVTGGGGFNQSLGFGVDADGFITGDNGQSGVGGTRIIKTGPPMGGVVDGGSIVAATYIISGQMPESPTGQYHLMRGGNFEGGPLMANCVEPGARLKLMVRPLKVQPARAKTWRGGQSSPKPQALSPGLSNPEPQISWDQTFVYDRFGNLTETVEGGQRRSISVNAQNNRLNGPGMVYDAVGNLIEDNGKLYTYDAENRMLTATVNGVTTNYFYDGEGKRIKKIVNGQVTRFVYGMGGELIAEYEGTTANPLTPTKEYLYGATGLLAVSEGTTLKYLTPDHLGSTRVITDSTGQVMARQDFYPFGKEIEADKAQRGSLAGYGTVGGVRQKFTGYERDEETGLDFAQARYYANSMGRFNSVDPFLPSGEINTPQTWNRYTYCINNPYRFVDPDGQKITGSSTSPGEPLSEEDRKQFQQALQKIAPGTKVDADGTVHKPGFFRRLINKFTGHGAGTKLISQLADSNTNVNVLLPGDLMDVMHNFDKERAAFESEKAKGIDIVIRWDPTTDFTLQEGDGSINSMIRSAIPAPAVVLGHELIHAQHRINRTFFDSLWDIAPVPHVFGGNGRLYIEFSPREELRTIGVGGYSKPSDITENQLRSQLGLPPRVSHKEIQ